SGPCDAPGTGAGCVAPIPIRTPATARPELAGRCPAFLRWRAFSLASLPAIPWGDRLAAAGSESLLPVTLRISIYGAQQPPATDRRIPADCCATPIPGRSNDEPCRHP